MRENKRTRRPPVLKQKRTGHARCTDNSEKVFKLTKDRPHTTEKERHACGQSDRRKQEESQLDKPGNKDMVATRERPRTVGRTGVELANLFVAIVGLDRLFESIPDIR